MGEIAITNNIHYIYFIFNTKECIFPYALLVIAEVKMNRRNIELISLKTTRQQDIAMAPLATQKISSWMPSTHHEEVVHGVPRQGVNHS